MELKEEKKQATQFKISYKHRTDILLGCLSHPITSCCGCNSRLMRDFRVYGWIMASPFLSSRKRSVVCRIALNFCRKAVCVRSSCSGGRRTIKTRTPSARSSGTDCAQSMPSQPHSSILQPWSHFPSA